MNTNRRNILITVAVLLLVLGVVLYRQFFTTAVPTATEQAVRIEEEETLRPISSIVDYEIPGGGHTIDFTIFVDDDGVVQNLEATDINDLGHQKRMDEFVMTLLPTIKGRSLAEIESVDRVGTASLTTEAFNRSLAELKAQL